MNHFRSFLPHDVPPISDGLFSNCSRPARSVSILGAGAWGSALADVLRSSGTDVTLWNRTPKLGCTSEISHVVTPNCEMILAISVQHALEVCQVIAQADLSPRICWIASKGLDGSTGDILSSRVQSFFPNCIIGVFSGPNIASEISQGQRCGMTVACADMGVLAQGAALFTNTILTPEPCTDIIGVQWWGALKNIMAIGYGLLQQCNVGHNMSATFLTTAAMELEHIVSAKGGKSKTTLSFAGIGDLILTSHCALGRNRFYGQHFPQKPTRLVEGLDTLRAFQQHTLHSAQWSVPTPMIQSIGDVLDGRLDLKDFPNVVLGCLR